MSLLPFAPVAPSTRETQMREPNARDVASRSLAPERARRLERSERAERPDATERPDRNERANTPPDFALLLALLGNNAAKPTQESRAAALTLELGDDTAPTVEQFAAEASPQDTPSDEADADTASVLARAVTMPDTEQRSLARSMRADALRIAQEIMADASRGRTNDLSFGDARTGRSAHERLGINSAELQSLADRARGTGLGELLARNDSRAAGVRQSLDALLDVAGTPRGRAIAESARPEFAAAVRASAADVTTAVRDTDALAPEFRQRLERVIDRMRDEFGHDVQVVETVRSSDRQEHLYAQGRTRPGPVVTWTTNSAHLSGDAADVIIDGKWHNPQGYTRLHEVAKEEGLHTLGMRDPGHLELPGASRNAAGTSDAAQSHAHAAAGSRAVNGVAQVASVARVAQVASVARVARPGSAGIGVPPAAATALDNSTTLAARLGGVTGSRAQHASGDHEPSADQGTRDHRRENASSARVTERNIGASDAPSAIGALGASVERVLEGGVPRVTAPVGSTAAARAEAIAVLRDDAPARPITSLTMQLDAPGGPEEIRVSMRGGTVGTQISTSNAALADRLRLQTADLQDALGRHGLDTEPLRVQQNARAQESDAVRSALTDRAELLRAGNAAAGQQSGQHNPQDPGARERPAARHHPEREARDARDDSHPQGRRHPRQENS